MSNFLQSIIDRDPAAKSKLSLILTYPGVKAIFFHKIANFFFLQNLLVKDNFQVSISTN